MVMGRRPNIIDIDIDIQGGAKRTHVFEIGSTSERYVEMLRNFLRPQLRSLRVKL